MTPKILEFREGDYNRQIDQAKSLMNEINIRIKELAGNGLKLSDKQLSDLFLKRDLNLAGELIPDKIKGDIKRQIEYETIQQFLNEAIHDLQESDLIEFKKGKCLISVDKSEYLKDTLTRSIKTPAGLELYTKLEQAVNLLNEAFNGSIPVAWRSIIQERDNQFVISRDLDFDFFVNRYKY